jgi:hypothetical protein
MGPMRRVIEIESLWHIFLFSKESQMPYASVAASTEVEVYAYWALIMVRMTYGSTGADPWTAVQDKLHPAVAEAEFTPLDFSYINR